MPVTRRRRGAARSPHSVRFIEATGSVGGNFLNGIDYAIVGLYLAAIVVLGIHLTRRANSSLEQYVLGGRSMPWWMLGVSGVMDFWDLAGTMIIVSFLFMLGPRGLFIEFRGGAVLVLAVIMVWTGKWHRRSRCMTAPEWMTFRFGDGFDGRLAEVARALAGMAITVGLVAYLAKGTGLFLSTLAPFSPAECAMVLIATATVYTMFSGFQGVVVIHLVQAGVVVIAAIVLIALGVSETSDSQSLNDLAQRVTGNSAWSDAAPTVRAAMPPGYKAYESLLLFAGLYVLRNVLFGMGAGDDPKYFAARSDADCAKLTLLWTTLIALRWPMMIAIAVLGLGVADELFPDRAVIAEAARMIRTEAGGKADDWATLTSSIANDPEEHSPELIAKLQQALGAGWRTKIFLVSEHGTVNPERIMPAVLIMRVPPGFRSLVVVSLIAAAMAGFAAWVNQSAGFFVRDIYQKFFRPQASMPELMSATWLFIMAMVAAGMALAYTAPTINDVWAWIVMGLGSGMIAPQMLPLYWWRFNGIGYAAGMATGVLAALAQRWLATHYAEQLPIIADEAWLLPMLGGAGCVAAVVASLLSQPTASETLQRFYLTTLPFGWWRPFRETLSPALRSDLLAEHRRDLAALPLALLYQAALYLTTMLAVIRNWSAFWASLAVTLLAFGGLWQIWLRKIGHSDLIAEAGRQSWEALTPAAAHLREATGGPDDSP